MNRKIKYYKRIFGIESEYVGWGRKPSGLKAQKRAEKKGEKFCLIEDGFIRSVDLGVKGSEPFSVVQDDIGIYYDATTPSRLERILSEYDFASDKPLMKRAKEAISLIGSLKISKYNCGERTLPAMLRTKKPKVLIVAQTAGDASLRYGLADQNPERMIREAIERHPESEIFVKVHPDVIAGKKRSNISLELAYEKCTLITENIHPVVLLEAFDTVYTQTSQMGFEALLLGKTLYLYGMPFYAGWLSENIHLCIEGGEVDRVLARRKRTLDVEEIFAGAYILYSRYYNPYRLEQTDIIDTIRTIDKYRRIAETDSGVRCFVGFSWWKRPAIRRFFRGDDQSSLRFNRCDNMCDKVFVWGKRPLPDKCTESEVYRVEDGFLRSLSLGSDLTQPYSLVVDSRGIYFDPTIQSDLEYLLENASFDSGLLDRAARLKNYLVEKRLSKYNVGEDDLIDFDTEKPIVLVIGQVEDDASIIYGGDRMRNIELLQRVSQKSEGFIVYKPHPDVEAGNRSGKISEEEALAYADVVMADASLPSLLDVCDEVHTITSLSGFEALLRGKKVYTYGMPFYAGWGLTIDEKRCRRRTRRLSLEALIAATYLLYPRYLSPVSGKLCEAEVVIEALEQEKKRYNTDTIFRWRTDIRNTLSRKIQHKLKVWFGE